MEPSDGSEDEPAAVEEEDADLSDSECMEEEDDSDPSDTEYLDEDEECTTTESVSDSEDENELKLSELKTEMADETQVQGSGFEKLEQNSECDAEDMSELSSILEADSSSPEVVPLQMESPCGDEKVNSATSASTESPIDKPGLRSPEMEVDALAAKDLTVETKLGVEDQEEIKNTNSTCEIVGLPVQEGLKIDIVSKISNSNGSKDEEPPAATEETTGLASEMNIEKIDDLSASVEPEKELGKEIQPATSCLDSEEMVDATSGMPSIENEDRGGEKVFEDEDGNFVQIKEEVQDDVEEDEDQNDCDVSDPEYMEEEEEEEGSDREREEGADEELDSTETLDTTAESVTELDGELALREVKTEMMEVDEESKSDETEIHQDGLVMCVEAEEDVPGINDSESTASRKDSESVTDETSMKESESMERKPIINDSESTEHKSSIIHTVSNERSTEKKHNIIIDTESTEKKSVVNDAESTEVKPIVKDSEFLEEKINVKESESTEQKPCKDENTDKYKVEGPTAVAESVVDTESKQLIVEAKSGAMEIDEEPIPSCSKIATESSVPEENQSKVKSSGAGPIGKANSRPVAVKRIREVRPPEPLPANVTTSITIGKPFLSAGGRKIETAVPRAGRTRESGSEGKSTASMTKCINEACNGLNTEFEKAPGHAVLYYGYVPVQGKNRYKICKTCLEGSGVYLEKSKEAMKAEKTVFDVPLCETANPCSTVFLEVSDPESDDEEVLEDIELDDDIPEDMGVDQILEAMLGNLRLKSQIDVCAEKLLKETDDIDLGFDATDELLEQADAELEDCRQGFQIFCGPTYNPVLLKSVEIDPAGKMTTLNSTDSETQEMLAANARNKTNARKANPELKEILNKRERETKESVTIQAKPVSAAEAIDEIKELKQVCRPTRRVLAATPTVIPRIMPKVGDTVYGMKNSALSFWIRGTVLEVIRNTINGQLEYKVQFEISRKGKSGANKDVAIQIKNMNPKHISYNLPCPFVLPVGTRVIALFKDEFKNEPIGANNYYAGIVAEPPKNTNTYRYLIFFDDGYAQYVGHEDVLLVCEASKEVWNDVHPDTKEFVKNYILKYPERPMVRLQKGTMMSTEWNGNWWIARVVEVDCSLVKIFFEEDNRYEWIYRGSTRLAPLYTKARGLEVGQGSTSTVPRRQNRGINSGHQKPVIEYTYEDQPALKAGMQTARKSTAAPPSRGPPQPSPDKRASSKPYQKPTGSRGYADLVEFEGSITKIIITDVKGPIPFMPHQCKPSCVRPFTESDAEIRKINPLSLPMYLGWAREVGKTPKRTIFYRAPCGRRLRDYDDLKKYLRETNYNMGIDYFCYDYSVDCLSEFVATRQHFQLRDISYGKEMVPVQCVNSVDHDYPEYVEYTRNRLPGKGVKINLDEEFLICCDCTDDCSDKEKCSCWQLTIEGTNLGKNTMNLDAGYQNRRLIDHVVSGIYECNARCKCRSTCSNRVVQNDLKWQLQIFKTATKGWAIRPLHDIPQGAFICVYAGQLLTEQGANEDGKAYGDEYLAELDYIEVIESVKEGYEAEAIEEENRRGGNQDRRKRSYQDFLDGDDDSGEEDDHCKDTDFVVRLSGNKSAGGRNQDNDQRKPKKSCLYNDSFDTSFARKPKPAHTSNADEDGSEEEDSSKVSTRALFGPDEQCYIMDAKSIGNIGRYLNHSCSPNVFVQNVFVDTHDIRFPWVAFFAYKHIRAGAELTWDYNYDIGSVPGKVMYCHCSSPDCRGRLL